MALVDTAAEAAVDGCTGDPELEGIAMDLVVDERAEEWPGAGEDLRAEEIDVVNTIVKREYVTNTYRATTTSHHQASRGCHSSPH